MEPGTFTGNVIPLVGENAKYILTYHDAAGLHQCVDHAIGEHNGLAPAMEVTKVLLSPRSGVAGIGDTLNFAILMTNSGTSDVASVSLTDLFSTQCYDFQSSDHPVNAGVTGQLGFDPIPLLAVGQTVAFKVSFRARAACLARAATNFATATGTVNGQVVSFLDWAPATIEAPDVSFSNTLSSPQGGSVPVGQLVTYDIAVTNHGMASLNHVRLNDQYDASCYDLATAPVPVPAADVMADGSLGWVELGPIAPGATQDVRVTLRAKAICDSQRAANVASLNVDDQYNYQSSDQIQIVSGTTIRGQVMDDANRNGVADPGEATISGAVVAIYAIDPYGVPGLVAETTTDDQGNYVFGDLPGWMLYQVVEQDPSGYVSISPRSNRHLVQTGWYGDYPGQDFMDAQGQSDLIVEKDAPALIRDGQRLSYTVTVSNAGPDDAKAAGFVDALPTDLNGNPEDLVWRCEALSQNVTCPSGQGTGGIRESLDLPAGSSLRYTVERPAVLNEANQGVLVNLAEMNAPEDRIDPVLENSADVVGTVLQTPPSPANLKVVNSGPSAVGVGEQVTHTITIVNAGYGDADGALLSFSMPANMLSPSWECHAAYGGARCGSLSGRDNINETIPRLPAGGTLIYTITGTAAGTAGEIVDGASIVPPSGVEDPDLTDNSSTLVTNIIDTPASRHADLAIFKTGPSRAAPGGRVSYTLNLFNNGPDAADGAHIVDALSPLMADASWTCSHASYGATCPETGPDPVQGNVNTFVPRLPAGSSLTIHITGIAPTIGTFANLAYVQTPADVADTNAANNVSPFIVTQSVEARHSDVAIVNTATDLISPNGYITYTLEVSNAGPDPADGILVSDPELTGSAVWRCTAKGDAVCGVAQGIGPLADTVSSLPAGAGHVLTYTITDVAPATTGMVSNTARIGKLPIGMLDPDSGNNQSTVDVQIVRNVGLSVLKKTDWNLVSPGDAITWTVDVTNNGPEAADGLGVIDETLTELAWWTCTARGDAVCGHTMGWGPLADTVANLPSGASNGLTFTITDMAPVDATGLLGNTARLELAPDMHDSWPGDNTSTVLVPIKWVADLSIEATSPPLVMGGDPLSYTLTVRNGGPAAVKLARVVDDVAALGLTDVNWSCDGLACPIEAYPVSGSPDLLIPTLAAGESVIITVNGRASWVLGDVLNTAHVYVPGDVHDTNPDNNDSQAVRTTVISPELDISMSAVPSQAGLAGTGEPISFDIVITNTGKLTLDDLSLNQTYSPDCYAYDVADPGLDSLIPGNLTWNHLSSLAPGQTQTVRVVLKAAATCDAALAVATATLSTHRLSFTAQNTGFVISAGPSISGFVISDNNGNGVIEPEDKGISNVPVRLYKLVDNVEYPWGNTVYTGVNGEYAFPLVDSQSTYVIRETDLAPYSSISPRDNRILAQVGWAGEYPNRIFLDTPAKSDLMLQKDAPAMVREGDVLAYKVVVSNAGPADAMGARLIDALPADLAGHDGDVVWRCTTVSGNATCPVVLGSGGIDQMLDLPSGSSLSYTIIRPAVWNVENQGVLSNVATVMAPADRLDPNPDNNSDVVGTLLQEPPAAANLRVTTSGPASVGSGENITYVIVAVNAGYGQANGARLADIVPEGLSNVSWNCIGAYAGAQCGDSAGTGNLDTTIPQFPAGGMLAYRVSGTAPAGPVLITNQASITAPQGVSDPDLADNTSTLITSVGSSPTNRQADLAIFKTGLSSVTPGNLVNYTLQIINRGPDAGDGAKVVDVVSSILSNVSWRCENPTRGAVCPILNPNPATGNVEMQVPVLPAGGGVTVTIHGTVPANGAFGNMAYVQAPSGVADPDYTNNISTSLVTQITHETMSGLVFQDNGQGNGIAGNGIRDGGEAGLNPGGLNVVALDAVDMVVGVAPVGNDGSWSLVVPVGTDYQAFITTASPVVGTSIKAVSGLPSGWVMTHENNGGTVDALDNGVLSGINPLYPPTAQNGLQFGIRQGIKVVDDIFASTSNMVINGSVASNDTVPVGGYFEKASEPLHGSLVFRGDGSFSYTPQTGWTGSDSFIYRACLWATACETATVTIGIASFDVTVTEQTGIMGSSQLLNVTDGITWQGQPLSQAKVDVSITVLSQATVPGISIDTTTGIVAVAPGTPPGTYQIVILITVTQQKQAFLDIFAPKSAVAGVGVSSDLSPGQNTEVKVIEVTVGSGPVAVADSYSTPWNTAISGSVGKNDSYPVGSTFHAITQPRYGLMMMDTNGAFTYSPTVNQKVVDSFDYSVCLPVPDNQTCSNATVTVTLNQPKKVQKALRLKANINRTCCGLPVNLTLSGGSGKGKVVFHLTKVGEVECKLIQKSNTQAVIKSAYAYYHDGYCKVQVEKAEDSTYQSALSNTVSVLVRPGHKK